MNKNSNVLHIFQSWGFIQEPLSFLWRYQQNSMHNLIQIETKITLIYFTRFHWRKLHFLFTTSWSPYSKGKTVFHLFPIRFWRTRSLLCYLILLTISYLTNPPMLVSMTAKVNLYLDKTHHYYCPHAFRIYFLHEVLLADNQLVLLCNLVNLLKSKNHHLVNSTLRRSLRSSKRKTFLLMIVQYFLMIKIKFIEEYEEADESYLLIIHWANQENLNFLWIV